MLRIGLDIDDVLYRTGLMTNTLEEAAVKDLQAQLQELREAGKVNTPEGLRLLYDISRTRDNVELEYFNEKWLNPDAIKVLKDIKKRYKVDYSIVTYRGRRYQQDIYDMLKRGGFTIPLNDIHCSQIYKMNCCKQFNIDTLLDDNIDNIRMFRRTTIPPIFTVTERTGDSLVYLQTYRGTVLYDWNDLENILKQLFGDKFELRNTK